VDTQTKRAFKDRLYEQFARLGKALASGRRLELLDLLAQGERGVEELAAETALSVANASQHLQVLRAAGLVESRRVGTSIRYRLADARVFDLWQALREVGEARRADIDRLVDTYLHEREALEAVSAGELRQRLADGCVTLLDVRPAVEYEAGHIATARSVPVGELASRLAELPRDGEVIAYCRGPYCVFADEAVALLQRHGFRARRLAVGLPDWRALGLPVDEGGGTP
jgi:rhodanese-related sulfurtransferase/DNA-binding transcriptional ArsR family regulator